MVPSVAVVSSPAPSASGQGAFLLTRCCCCCTLSQGVFSIAVIEIFSWLLSLIAAGLAIYVKTQEGAIDTMIKQQDASHDVDRATTHSTIKALNAAINSAAIASPFLIVLALCGIWMARKGIQAARGDIEAAKVKYSPDSTPLSLTNTPSKAYFSWRRFICVWTSVQLLFGLGSGGGLPGLLLTVYFALVVRSHWLALAATSAPLAEVQQEVSAVVVVIRPVS